jgi:4-amino-4-deoxy-L-arabinose transferase-like glycosyltransferase
MTQGRIFWGLLAAVVAVAVVVVTLAFNPVPHAGGDNAGYVGLAHGLLDTGSYTDVFDPEGLPHTKYPPVFPVLLASLIALGARTWISLKLTASVATVATVAFTYLWAERSIGALGAVAVALLLTLSAGVVYYSHWILSDPVFVAFTVVALFALTRADEDQAQVWWLPLGVMAVGLAYFTRSAGLPLVLALLLWLALRRRWRAVGLTAMALGVPMLLWWLRGRGAGVAAYGSEFWMVDPYQPGRGTVGIFGLIPRVIGNLASYVLDYAPSGIVGGGPFRAPLGVLLAIGTLAGWALSVRSRIGPAEIFFPLYAGLILVWPEIWGGDRFFLPLYPLVFLYGAVSVRSVADRLPTVAASGVTAIAILVLLLPAGADWFQETRRSASCARAAAERGAWACYGPQVGFFAGAALWSASGLPVGSAVMTRKPRHFYLLSGHPSRTFPFDPSATAQLSLADAIGARYVLLDQWDGQAARYVGSAIREQPSAFCYVGAFGQTAAGGAQLFGILAPEDRTPGASDEEGALSFAQCPEGYRAALAADTVNYTSSGRIPLLDGLDS